MSSQDARPASGHIVIAFLSFVALGLRAGLLSVAWPSMRDTFGVSLDAVGVLFIVGTVGYLLVSVQSGRIIARIGLGAYLVWGAIIAGVSYLGHALAPTWGFIIGLTLLASVGTAIIDAGLNTYFAINQSAGMMNWLHACFGLGGMLSPILMTGVLSRGLSWRWGFVPVGAAYVALIAGFALTRTRWPRGEAVLHAETAPAPTHARTRDTLALPVVWLSLLLFVAFTGMEGTSGQWPYTLFTEGRGIAPTTAGLWVSIAWGATTAGRIIFGFIVKYVAPHTLLRVCMAAIVATAGLLWWNPSDAASFIALAGMALMLAPLFPIATATTAQRVGAEHTSNAIGFQMAAARVGLALAPALAGVVAKAYGLESIGAFLLVNAVVMLVLNEILVGRMGNPSQPNQSKLKGETHMREHTQLTVYGTRWCPDVRRARRFLDEHQVAYTYVDIDQDGEARTYCDDVHDGCWIVPTIAFPDGTLLFDPSARELAAKLGIEL